jgi:hypothetical protein
LLDFTMVVTGKGDLYAVTDSGLELKRDPKTPPKEPSTPQEFLKDFR